MKSRNTAGRTSAKFRRSWIYWANMHGHFGDDCRGPIVGNGMEGVQLWTASNAQEAATWCTCEHNTNQFLTWHRMYLYYFEQVLRQAANDPTLTLPYWDEATDRQAAAGVPRPDLCRRNRRDGAEPALRRRAPADAQRRHGEARAATTSSANAMKATRRSDFESVSKPRRTARCIAPSPTAAARTA